MQHSSVWEWPLPFCIHSCIGLFLGGSVNAINLDVTQPGSKNNEGPEYENLGGASKTSPNSGLSTVVEAQLASNKNMQHLFLRADQSLLKNDGC